MTRRAVALLLGCVLALVRVSAASAACVSAEESRTPAAWAAAAAPAASALPSGHAHAQAPGHLPGGGTVPNTMEHHGSDHHGTGHHGSHDGMVVDCLAVHCAAVTTARLPRILPVDTVDTPQVRARGAVLRASDAVREPALRPPRD